tara:strand:+ start:5828 stop:6787 length:960 start_codon:yes stop_codon:yes gene_type:complete
MEERKKVLILAFNLGLDSHIVNGPGISLRNLLVFFSKYNSNLSFEVFSNHAPKTKINGVKIYNIKNSRKLRESLDSADILHCWSGLFDDVLFWAKEANKLGKKVILGPNLFDLTSLSKEVELLRSIKYSVFLTANPRLKHLISNRYKIPSENMFSFMVGPDLDLWTPPDKVDTFILWKGNSRQPVKDFRFAKELKKVLPRYKFLFLTNYNYLDHIKLASSARLYINTSLSETKGMAQLEQMAAGVPSITHPKIFCHGVNYKTGIVASKSIRDYAEAIDEVLSHNLLRKELRVGARRYVEERFFPEDIVREYIRIVEYAC